MKKSGLAAVAFGFLALAACGQNNQDKLNQADVNAPADNLDMLANDAANQATEQDVLQNQANQLNQEATTDNAAGAQTPADENIAGM
jgi:predicted small lipoprotein YifL